MRRLFSAFPGGWAGFSLLWLRFALLLILIGGITPTIGSQVVLGCTGAMVVAGFLTPFVSGAVAAVTLGTAGWSLLTGAPLLFDSLRVHVLLGAVATALIMIGPGAYSVDARLFGWRELRMPDP
jgi:uncharacterized membrane protein YphA (DoxX/SURF4 family)